MTKKEFKKEIFQNGLAKQQQIIEDFKERIKDIRESEIAEVGQYDMQEASFRDEIMDKIDHFSSQLNFVTDEMTVLKKINPERDFEKAQFGSVVETDRGTFFVSVSLERFKVGKREVFGISTEAPVFKAMEGKSIGDTFETMGNTFEIKDIY